MAETHGPIARIVSDRLTGDVAEAAEEVIAAALAAGPGALLGGWLGEVAGLRWSLVFAGSVTLVLAAAAFSAHAAVEPDALVRDLSTALLPAGRHEVPWDGRDRSGRPSPSGVYLYKLEAGGQMLAGRMTLSK